MQAADVLETYLWDLRAQAESKLRCLTRVQQMAGDYRRAEAGPARDGLRDKIQADLADVVSISKSLNIVSAHALDAANDLP